MKDVNLFQLGIGLETGAQEEDSTVGRKAGPSPDFKVIAGTDVPRDILDENRDDHFIRDGKDVFAGTHLIIEVVDGDGLDDEARIQKAFRDCVTECGATLLHIHTHKFSPQGVSGVAVLAESHISVHTWPEIRYGAFDVFMCGDAQPWRAVDVLGRAFNTSDIRVKELRRGVDVVADQLGADE